MSSGLNALRDRFDAIGDVRTRGCFSAIEFVVDHQSRERDLAFQGDVAMACLTRGLLADSSTTSYNIQPSLITPIPVVERALAIVSDAIDEVTTRRR